MDKTQALKLARKQYADGWSYGEIRYYFELLETETFADWVIEQLKASL